jgi:hypothetical protein
MEHRDGSFLVGAAQCGAIEAGFFIEFIVSALRRKKFVCR